ncbi:unnamed protein product [Prorocentrum cordatum]|uniref:Choline transporter-like protein n=1 Tax=Prorocentrum cordatum TaxID=2364126 RepID=A0ABN9W0B0_9DINO|nr:unnamed protein product [Polarella glacialis]
MTGDGSDYVGYQTLTRSGTLCQEWAIGTPHSQPYQNASSFAGSPGSLADVRNYCRNPAAASTIWCFTVDTEKVWELCSPIGVLQPDCPSGYAVSSESNREAMKIVAYVLWTFAGIWLLLVWCLLQRIRLAIATSKVAALFVMHTPGIVLVPVVQVVVGICWCLIWCLCASFLMSQVPEDFVPTSVYATYREAAGTADTPGPCTGTWPAGFVWKDEENALCSSGQSVPRCWRCGLPRYVLGYKFAFAFFSFLWNSALGVALGQCVVAYSCAVWYFQEPHDRGGPKQSHGVQAAVRTCLRYHLGSLALGSFLVALVKFIRYVLMYLEKNAKAQKNKVMVMVFKCLQCCLWCFEKCMYCF